MNNELGNRQLVRKQDQKISIVLLLMMTDVGLGGSLKVPQKAENVKKLCTLF